MQEQGIRVSESGRAYVSGARTPQGYALSPGMLWMEMEELGLHGPAVLQKVEACPAIEAGPGRVITATITHPNAEIYELRVTGNTATDPGTLMGSQWTLMTESQTGVVPLRRSSLCGVESPSSRLDYSPSLRYTQPRMKTWMQSMMLGLIAMLMPVASAVQAASLPQEEVAIQTTGAHPFLSKTRHAWVSARDLQAGEELRSQDGEELRVASLGRIPGAQPVFNLEVEREHVYFVSGAGVLVHNGYLNNQLPGVLDKEMNLAKRLGIKPIVLMQGGVPDFVNDGAVKYVVTRDG
jgi:Pretoxin HINT domain